MIIDKSTVTGTTPDFVKNRVAMQDEYMLEIERLFTGNVRANLPLLETEVRGVHMLQRMAGLMYQ